MDLNEPLLAIMPPQDSTVLPAELVLNLNKVLLDLHQHPYPEIPSPPGVPKRASVALIIRIQPNYTHWPPSGKDDIGLNEQSQFISVEDRINTFFNQDWVQHGDPEVLFIKRAARVGDKWTRHVAFPGGRRDSEDAEALAAAVREAWEEVGIDLSEENAIASGNLPQRIVTSAWGKQASATDAPSYGLMSPLANGRRLMTLCPYIFLVTSHEIPPLKLQPTEVASTHWVPLRALLSPAQRTYWYQDVTSRTTRTEFNLEKWFHRFALGKMMFAAVRLIPSESKYCSSIAEFMPEEPMKNQPRTFNLTIPLYGESWHKPGSPVDSPLLLWGLTLGVMGDFLDMLPPHNALQIWTYPTFTQLDVRFILWAMSYRFRKQKQKELEEGAQAMPAVELGSDSVAIRNDADSKPGEGRVEGMGLGRYYGRWAQDQKGSRSSAVGVLLGGYYEIIHKAVLVSFITRLSVIAAVGFFSWKEFVKRR
jgi:8-oxo-dGTP pyrophosphatase MutT (NUDIX family)